MEQLPTYTNEDVCGLADELGVDRGVALDRVNDWESVISGTARSLIRDQLMSVIARNQPTTQLTDGSAVPAGVGRREDALAATEQAVEIRRQWPARDPTRSCSTSRQA